jgi:ATP/maltotriose-dependent transcriptional regulator MalT
MAEPSESEMVGPLSQREPEVLHLIAEGLTNQDIACRLFLSQNTVKAHTHNIHGRIGVTAARKRLPGPEISDSCPPCSRPDA